MLQAGNRRGVADDHMVNATQTRRASSPETDPLTLAGFELPDDPARALYWKRFEWMRARWRRTAIQIIARQFERERMAVESVVESSLHVGDAIARAELTINQGTIVWRATLEALYDTVGVDFARRVARGVKAATTDGGHLTTKGDHMGTTGAQPDLTKAEDDAIVDRWRRTIDGWLGTEGGKRIRKIQDTTRKEVQRELLAGVQAGEGIPQMARRINRLYRDEFTLKRAVGIARTEVISASNLGSRAGALSTGLDLSKEWIATSDERTREAHAAANGQTTPMHEAYVVMGEQLMFPGDTSLGASGANVVMCRCTEGYARAGAGRRVGQETPAFRPFAEDEISFAAQGRLDELLATGKETPLDEAVLERIRNHPSLSKVAEIIGSRPEAKSVAETVQSIWNATSRNNAVSMVMQEAVAAEFQIAGTTLPQASFVFESEAARLTQLREHLGFFRTYARAQYDHTQAFFASRGVSEVVLYRGMSFRARPSWIVGEDGGIGIVQLQPLSSFSGVSPSATSFATPADGGYGLMMATRVKVSRLFSTGRTGFGTIAETEFTILGGKIEAALTHGSTADSVKMKALKAILKRLGLLIKAAGEAIRGRPNIDADLRQADWLKRKE